MDRLTAMEAFVRVVDAGSFSYAAKQPSLSRGTKSSNPSSSSGESIANPTSSLRRTRRAWRGLNRAKGS
jgi:hypothetical protein